ncbi:MAG: SDR family oxidoreductase [Gemmataceae bacterium]
MAKALSEQVVVLTGASSGIGRETALTLGRRGARVVLAARTTEALDDVAREVQAAGGQAHVVPTDVTDFAQVERLAAEAVRRFGRIDTWVNDAGVSEYARVEDARVDEIRRVLDTNLVGAVHGMKAALPVMRRQGAGTIVNVSSVLGKFSVPLQAAYCASKHGLIGFADALRLELKREGAGVEVVNVMPSSIDTPFFDHARAKLGGKRPQPIPPAYDPAAVADAIACVCESPQRDVVVGGAGRLFILLNRLSPWLLDRLLLVNDAAARQQISDKPAVPKDNLAAPSGGTGSSRGSFGDLSIGSSPYTRWWELSPAVRGLAVAGLAAVAVGALGAFRRSDRSGGRWAGHRDLSEAAV